MQGEEEEKEQKPVWLQEDGQEVGTPTSANASGLNLQAPAATQPHDPQGAADFIGLDDDDVPGQLLGSCLGWFLHGLSNPEPSLKIRQNVLCSNRQPVFC